MLELGGFSLAWWVHVRSRPFTTLVLQHGTDSPSFYPFVVVYLQYGERSRRDFHCHVGRRRGPSRDTPSSSNIISSLSMEKLRSYCQIPDNIDIEFPDGRAKSTINEGDGAVYFTREQLAVGLHFPMSSLIKHFLHYFGAPPTLIHPNIIRILVECSVLNLRHQLDISLVEVYFIYTLKLAHSGQLSLSA